MTVASPSKPRSLAQDCGELATAVAIARDAIGRGGTADLDALAQRLADLLDVDATAPAAEPDRRRRGLLALAEEIEALGGVIGDEQRRCSDELARGGPSSRAVAAYTKITRFEA